MKTSEFRIGNFIGDAEGSAEVYIVHAIEIDRIHAGKMSIYPAGLEIEHGIPLTEEWLLKFGYKKQEWNEDSVWQLSSIPDVNLHDTDAGFIFDMGKSKPISYVHQLQNLYFALTGEELIVKT